MKLSKKAVLGSLLMMGVGSAFANTADMQVTGVIAPVACTADFVGGGVLDWGDIDPSTLNGPEASGTFLPQKRISYTVSCAAPVAIATSFSDGRVDSGWSNFFGLGLKGGVSVGGYRIADVLEGGQADGAVVDRIYSLDGGVTWLPRSVVGWNTTDGSTMSAFAPTGTLVPGAYQNYIGRVIVAPFVRGGLHQDMTQKIDLDGLATLTVRYL